MDLRVALSKLWSLHRIIKCWHESGFEDPLLKGWLNFPHVIPTKSHTAQGRMPHVSYRLGTMSCSRRFVLMQDDLLEVESHHTRPCSMNWTQVHSELFTTVHVHLGLLPLSEQDEEHCEWCDGAGSILRAFICLNRVSKVYVTQCPQIWILSFLPTCGTCHSLWEISLLMCKDPLAIRITASWGHLYSNRCFPSLTT